MVVVYRLVGLVPARPSGPSTAVRSGRSCSAPVTNASSALRHAGGQLLAVGDGVAVPEAQLRARPGRCGRRASSERRSARSAAGRSRSGRRPRRSAWSAATAAATGAPHLGVHALQLPQPGDVLGGGDGGVRPEGEQGDDGHHQQADDLRADGPGAQQPAARRARVASAGAASAGSWPEPSSAGGPAWARRPRTAGAGGGCGAGCAGVLRGVRMASSLREWFGGDGRWRGRSRVRSVAGRRAPAGRRPPVLSTGRWAEAEAARSPAVGESATKAEVRKR